jgi:hypothetical protein
MELMDRTSLDGKYRISSVSNYEGPLERRSDGVTEIRNGETARFDDNGILWRSRFTPRGEDEVEMTSVADPSEAKPGAALKRPDGSPTLEPVTYGAILKLSRKGDKIRISGQVQYGNEIVILTLSRIGD